MRILLLNTEPRVEIVKMMLNDPAEQAGLLRCGRRDSNP